MGRDRRLDIVRGYAMLTISINHISFMFEELGLTGKPIPTLSNYGSSSAAELFTVLSGYMIGIIYLDRDNIFKALGARAARLYLYNLAAFGAVIIIATISGQTLSTATGASYIIESPSLGVLKFVLLAYQPDLLDVLPLYVLFFLITPGIAWLMSRRAWICVTLSVVLYAIVQVEPDFNLPGGGGLWTFNPFAWQFLFLLGLIAGKYRLHDKLISPLEANAVVPVFVILAFVTYTGVCYTGRNIGLYFPMTDRETLGMLRIFHMVAVLAFFFSILTILRRHLDNPLVRLTELIGKHTLTCYTASIVATYGAAALWLEFGRSYTGYLVSAVSLVAIVTLVAIAAESRKRSKRLDRHAQPAVTEGQA